MNADSAPFGPSFGQALAEAAEQGRSGVLEAYGQGERIGSAVLQEGRVAWAVCLYQPENLGSFLRRLGQISQEHLEAATAEYAEHGGRRKLGRILQEAGLVSAPVLRRCLLLHVRMALACMLRNEALVGIWDGGVRGQPEDVAFELGELFPEVFSRGGPLPEVGDAGGLARGLEGFSALAGYRASVVLDPRGRPLAVHVAPEHPVVDEHVIAAVVANLAETGTTCAGQSGLGEATVVVVEGTRGALALCRTEGEVELLVALFLDSGARTGVALHRLRSCAEAIASSIAIQRSEGQ